jgi:hypothetical protein
MAKGHSRTKCKTYGSEHGLDPTNQHFEEYTQRSGFTCNKCSRQILHLSPPSQLKLRRDILSAIFKERDLCKIFYITRYKGSFVCHTIIRLLTANRTEEACSKMRCDTRCKKRRERAGWSLSSAQRVSNSCVRALVIGAY